METGNSSVLLQGSPAVIRNAITEWKVLKRTKEDWCNLFKDKILKFRKGSKTYSETPHWECLCESKDLTLDRFFELSTPNSDHWLYFDYKYVKDVFCEKEEFIKEFKWADLGLIDLHGEESALWIGNEGAHTPCHRDTYGCNVVAQLFGRKMWILMPPEEIENLKAVRVPYEESSIYSLINFYKPDNSLLNIKQAYKVILSPGDVLYVPRHWWHYVENLEPAISINIWVPLDEDHESRLEESLVQYYISNICQDLSEEEAKKILNPNEYSLISKPCNLSLVEKCLGNYKKYKNSKKSFKPAHIENRLQGETLEVERLCIKSFIKEQTKKKYEFSPLIGMKAQDDQNSRISIAAALINSYCGQSHLNSVKAALLESKIIRNSEPASKTFCQEKHDSTGNSETLTSGC